MERHAKEIIVFALAGMMLSGVGASIAQAATPNLDNRQSEMRFARGPGDNDRNRVINRRSGRVFGHARYNTPHWRASRRSFVHRAPWAWHSRNHIGRSLIVDAAWDAEFPGLRSYRWNGRGFYYGGREYQDVVMFYDDGDTLVSVGVWDRGRFIMIRDDNRSYYNRSPFVSRYYRRSPGVQLRIRL